MIGKDLNNQEKLAAIYEMTLENNSILRTIRRQHYFSNFLSSLYWLMVIGVIGGTYYFVRPVVTAISNNSGQVEETINQFNQIRSQLPETKLINQVIKGLKTNTRQDYTAMNAGNRLSGKRDYTCLRSRAYILI